MLRRKLFLTVGALATLGLAGPAFADDDDDVHHTPRVSPLDRLKAKLPLLGAPLVAPVGDEDWRRRREWEHERSHEWRPAPYGVPYDQGGRPYATPPAPEDSDRYAPPPEDSDQYGPRPEEGDRRYREDDRYPPRWPYQP